MGNTRPRSGRACLRFRTDRVTNNSAELLLGGLPVRLITLSRHGPRGWCGSAELVHHGTEYFIYRDRRSSARVKAARIEKLFQKGRDNLFLQPVSVYLPGTGAGENGNTSHAAAQCQMHGQAVTGDETAVALHICQMIEQHRSAL